MGVESPEEGDGDVIDTNGTTFRESNTCSSDFIPGQNKKDYRDIHATRKVLCTVIFEMFLKIRFVPLHFAALRCRGAGIQISVVSQDESFSHVGASSAHGPNQQRRALQG